MEFERKVKKIGTSFHICIPIDLMKFLNINEGDTVTIQDLSDKSLLLKKRVD